MATNVVFNGVSYSVPAEADDGWGPDLSAYLISIASNSFQKTGGSFTLTAEADFGATYGLKSPYYTSKGTNPASSGAVRLANAEGIYWRNAANNANLGLVVNSSNVLQFNGVTLLASGLIVNADIDAAAAIAYSKLNLAGSIVNADISNSAAIAYSKLNLSTSIVNADISASAAIAYSKLNLTGLIVDADIGASAAIALSKLAAVTASRALVSDASGFVSASSVTATELGYLSGVTSAVQTQLDGKIAKSLLTTSGDLIYASGSSTPARLAVGSSGQVLKVVGGAPTWATFSGGINYLSANPDAESDTSGYSTYADSAGSSPVDGTGGSPNITWTRTTSSPLRGSGSFLFTKDAANRQGEGASYDFTIDAADKAKVLKIEFDYIVASGTFTAGNLADRTSSGDSDLTVWVYDVTNSTLIQPSTYRLYSNSSTTPDKFSAYFQSASNSTSYRLIFHNGTTSTSAFAVKFDNFNVGPSTYVYGTPVTDWLAYTPTGSWVTNATYSGFWRRVGDQIQVRAKVVTSGAPTAASLTFSLPSGLTFDTSKLVGTSQDTQNLGIGQILDTGTANYLVGNVGYASSSTVGVYVIGTAATYGGGSAVNATTPFTFGSTDQVSVEFSGPITGWSSSVQMSDSADTRVVAVRVTNSTTSTVGTTPTKIPYANVTYDTHGAWNTAGTFTAPVSGYYRVTVMLTTTALTSTDDTNGRTLDISLYKNGVQYSLIAQNRNTRSTVSHYYEAMGSDTVYCNAGNTLEIYATNTLTGSSTTLIGSADYNHVAIEKVNGPSAIAATETIAAKYTAVNTTTFTTSGVVADFATKVFDTHGAVTTGSGWRFTAPAYGIYHISVGFYPSSTVGLLLNLQKNGSAVERLAEIAASATAKEVSASTEIELNAGDYIDLKGFSGSSTLTFANDAALNRISIFRINK